MKFKSIAALALVAMMVAPALGADDEKKKERKGKKGAQRSPVAAMLKKLEPVGLTDDQVAKIKDIGAKMQAELKSAREAAGITQELQKKLTAANKAVADKKLKGKERIAAIHKEAGLTEAQSTAVLKINQARGKLNSAILAVLTDDQKAKLPDSLKRMANAKKGGAKKGAKKGDAKKAGEKKKKKDAA